MNPRRDPVPRWVPRALLAALAIAYPWTLGRPSLWLDEAWEANYYAGFAAAPWYNRPMLYMASVRGLVALAGPSEWALRLLPCVAGLAAVIVTYRLARRGLPRAWSLLASGLLAFSAPFLRESHQLKHYAFDALFAALLVWTYLRWRETRSAGRLSAYVAAALLSFGFSFGSIFILFGLALFDAASERSAPAGLKRSLAVHAILAACFAVNFLAFHRDGGRDPLLVAYFSSEYAPWRAPWRLPLWLARGTAAIAAKQTGASSGIAALLLAAAGWWAARRSGASAVAWTLAAAVAANAAASALSLYPFGVERLSIYLAPLVAIVIAHGVALLGRRAPAGPLLASVVVVLLFGPSASAQAAHLVRPPVREEIRDFVTRLAREAAPGETLYVAEDALSAFQFYWSRAGRSYPPDGLVMAARMRQDPARHRDETERLAATGAPVWSLLTHMPAAESDTIAALMTERFQHAGMDVVGDARLDYWKPR